MLANTIGTSFPKRLMIRARLRQFEYESNSVDSVCQIEHDLSTIHPIKHYLSKPSSIVVTAIKEESFSYSSGDSYSISYIRTWLSRN